MGYLELAKRALAMAPEAPPKRGEVSIHDSDVPFTEAKESIVPPVVWQGTVFEYRSLLVLREAELVVAKAQLTGNDRIDWFLKNRIFDLEGKTADLKRWLAEAMEKTDDH